MSGVAVKPLEWDDQGNWWGSYADTVVGTFNVAQCRNTPKGDGVRSTDWFVSYPHTDDLTIHPDEVTAKAAAQADYDARIRSAHVPPAPTHRHKKRGTEYVLIGIGKMQAEYWNDMNRDADGCACGPPVDMREVAIYRSVDDGSLWVRPREEFEDGRFEPLPAPPTGGQ